jgi:hypothetical protein
MGSAKAIRCFVRSTKNEYVKYGGNRVSTTKIPVRRNRTGANYRICMFPRARVGLDFLSVCMVQLLVIGRAWGGER